MASKSKKTKTRKTPKTRKKRKTGKKAEKNTDKPSLKRELTKIVTGFIILVFIVVTAAMFADYFLNNRLADKSIHRIKTKAEVNSGKQVAAGHGSKNRRTVSPVKENLRNKKKLTLLRTKRLASMKKKSHKEPMFEIFDDTIDHVKIKRPVLPSDVNKTPVVAIIIDDIGFDKKMARDLSDLNPNITFSVLPDAPFGKEIAGRLHKKGIHIMLHLPMEPVEYPRINPGPGAILADMPPDQVLRVLRRDIKRIPYIQGINNHMGSRITTMSDKMRQIFTILKEKNLFFIDSRTTRNSVCRPCARLLQIPFAQRDVFLDNFQSTAYIKKQLKELIRIAEKHGTAIAIGHPYKATLQALKEELPIMEGKVRLVPVSSLTSISG